MNMYAMQLKAKDKHTTYEIDVRKYAKCDRFEECMAFLSSNGILLKQIEKDSLLTF